MWPAKTKINKLARCHDDCCHTLQGLPSYNIISLCTRQQSVTNCFCLPQTRVWMSAFRFRNKPVCSWKNIPAQSPDISVVFSLIESSIIMSDNKAYSCNSQIFFEKRILNGKIITITLTVNCLPSYFAACRTWTKAFIRLFVIIFYFFVQTAKL